MKIKRCRSIIRFSNFTCNIEDSVIYDLLDDVYQKLVNEIYRSIRYLHYHQIEKDVCPNENKSNQL